MAPYDESIKVPLYISGPGWRSNQEVLDPVLLIDLTPTVLDLAGLEVPDYMDGYSLLSSESSDDKNHQHPNRTEVLLQYMKYEEGKPASQPINNELTLVGSVLPHFLFVDVPAYVAIRTLDHLFVEFHHVDKNTMTPEWELYDTRKDPYQMRNLVNHPEHSQLVSQFKTRLNVLKECSGKSCYDPNAEPPKYESLPVDDEESIPQQQQLTYWDQQQARFVQFVGQS